MRAVYGSSNNKAIRYITKTKTDTKIPVGLPYHKAVPKKHNVEPLYIGLLLMLKGNEVTLSFIKIPK